MVIQPDANKVRVTLTLDPIDVQLLDRLAALEGLNRSAELRSILAQMRPMLRQTVEAFEAALASRDLLSRAAQDANAIRLQQLLPEAQRAQDSYLGLMARIEGEAAAAAAQDAADPRPSNHGGHTPTPPPTDESA